MKKIFSVLLCITMLMCSATGCGSDDKSNVDSTSEQSQGIEYKTIEPPEDGWTIEELMSVTYLCGKKLTYPLTMEYLGEDFSLDEANKTVSKSSVLFPLLYKNKKIGLVSFKKNSEKSSDYENITNMMFNIDVNATALDCIVVNGISLGSSNTDVKSMIGTPHTKSTDEIYAYTIHNGDDKFLNVVMKNKTDVIGINIYLKRK